MASETEHGRLGLPRTPELTINGGGVPFPVELHIPGVRIVSVIAGGM
jgi:SCF-associated factor 1